MKTFSCRTRIFCGTGAVETLGSLGAKRLMLVTDPFFAKDGTAKRIAALSGAAETEIYDEVKPEPTVEQAAAGASRVKAFGPDVLVALGGGSAMDLAKAMAHFGGCQRLVAIPSTSGSGSEVTDFAVLTKNGVKYPLVDEKLAPEAAILDDDLLKDLPKSLIADGGFDVLTHAAEAFVAQNATPMTDALAQEAFAGAWSALPGSYAGKKDLRLSVHLASTMAGLAFTNAGLGLCHALAHALGGRFHVPHGRLNGVLLPAVIEANACPERYAVLARRAGLGGSADAVAARNLKNGLIRLRRELGLPGTLAEAGIAPQALWQAKHQLVADALADPCCGTNPRRVDGALAERVLEACRG